MHIRSWIACGNHNFRGTPLYCTRTIGRHARGFRDTTPVWAWACVAYVQAWFCDMLGLLNAMPSFGGEMALARATRKETAVPQCRVALMIFIMSKQTAWPRNLTIVMNINSGT